MTIPHAPTSPHSHRRRHRLSPPDEPRHMTPPTSVPTTTMTTTHPLSFLTSSSARRTCDVLGDAKMLPPTAAVREAEPTKPASVQAISICRRGGERHCVTACFRGAIVCSLARRLACSYSRAGSCPDPPPEMSATLLLSCSRTCSTAGGVSNLIEQRRDDSGATHPCSSRPPRRRG